jgi:hypothetical protein
MLTTPSSAAAVFPFEPSRPQRFIMLRHTLVLSTTWRSLPANARAVYVDMAARYNGRNNGRIPYSARDGAEALQVSKDTAWRALKLLEDRALIICRRRGSFDLKTKETQASEWEFTEYSCGEEQTEAALVRPVGPVGPTHRTGNGFFGPTHRTLIDKNLDIDGKDSKILSLPKGPLAPPDNQPSGFPSHTEDVPRAAAPPGVVPRAAVPGDVPPGADDELVLYDTPRSDLAERFMHRAIGKPFLRYGRARGFYLAKSEWQAIEALAAADGGGR